MVGSFIVYFFLSDSVISILGFILVIDYSNLFNQSDLRSLRTDVILRNKATG